MDSIEDAELFRPSHFFILNPDIRNKGKLLMSASSSLVASSERFSAGSILCCEFVGDSDVAHCNKRFILKRTEKVSFKIWDKAVLFGVRGEEVGDVYIEAIKQLEATYKEGVSQKDVQLSGEQ